MTVVLKAQYGRGLENGILYGIFQVVFRFYRPHSWGFYFPCEVTKQMQLDSFLVLDILINMSCCELWFEHCRSYSNIVSSETGDLSHVLLHIVVSTYLNTNDVMNALPRLMSRCNYWILQHKLCTI
jgi:hypothetical protein